MKIRLAHSPDADDAFMFFPLMAGKVDTRGLEFEEVREEIEALNRKAQEGVYDVSAISLHAYPFIQERYLLLPTGACFGENYGPTLVSNKPLKPRQVLRLRCAIPGKKTTAFLLMKLWEREMAGEGRSGLSYTEVPFDQIINLVASKKMDLGLLIHEGQLTYGEKGLTKVVDLGEWWHKETSLSLPLGALVVKRDLDWEVQKNIALAIHDSVRYALEHREEAVEAALPFARGLDSVKTEKFIGMYVGEKTVDIGRAGQKAIRLLFEKGFSAGLIPSRVDMQASLLDFRRPPSSTNTVEPPPAPPSGDYEIVEDLPEPPAAKPVPEVVSEDEEIPADVDDQTDNGEDPDSSSEVA